MRGAGIGGATGLLAGLVAVAVPPLAGVALTTLGGAAVGPWASSLVGASLPDPIGQKFKGEIETGRILVVIDGEGATLANAEAALRDAGAVQLPDGDPAAMH